MQLYRSLLRPTSSFVDINGMSDLQICAELELPEPSVWRHAAVLTLFRGVVLHGPPELWYWIHRGEHWRRQCLEAIGVLCRSSHTQSFGSNEFVSDANLRLYTPSVLSFCVLGIQNTLTKLVCMG